MDKKQLLHDIALAYLLYESSTTDNPPLSPEDFYQEYEKLTGNFENIVSHYNR